MTKAIFKHFTVHCRFLWRLMPKNRWASRKLWYCIKWRSDNKWQNSDFFPLLKKYWIRRRTFAIDIFFITLIFNSLYLAKFIYSEKAAKFWQFSTLLLSVSTVEENKVEISQNFVAFSAYTNFKNGSNFCHLSVLKFKKNHNFL